MTTKRNAAPRGTERPVCGSHFGSRSLPPDLDAASLAALGDGEIVALALRTVTLPPTGALAAMGPPIHVSGNTFIGNWDPSTESQIMQAIRKAMRRGL